MPGFLCFLRFRSLGLSTVDDGPLGVLFISRGKRGSGPMELVDEAEQLCLKDELALLVLFIVLKCFVVLPPNDLFTLPACDVADDVAAGRHAAFGRFASLGINNRIE